jgi:Ca-activated chloride channel homolog
MKEILDRHAERLSPEERRAIWEKVARTGLGESRAILRWALPAAAAMATVVVAVIVFAVMQRQPADLQRSAPTRRAEVSTRTEAPAPERDRVQPAAPGRLAPMDRQEARRAAAASPAGHGITPAATPVASDTRAAIPPDAVEPRARAANPSPATTASTGAVTGRITDSRNRPVPYANVLVPSIRQGTQSDVNGDFVIPGVPAGEAEVRAMATGYGAVTQKVTVNPGAASTLDFAFGEQKSVKQLENIEVSAERRISDLRMSTISQSIIGDKAKSIPVDHLREAARAKAGNVAQGGELHFRGGRGGEVKFQFDGAPAAPAPPPVIPTTGGTMLPNDETYDSMFFRNYGVNPFIATDEDALSTFAVDVDAASYTLARRYIELGHLPPADAVRVEEFVNFFPQGYPRFGSDDFRILIDGAPSPFGRGYHLLRIGLKGREIVERDRKPARLTFVIDVSGSMAREDRLELVKRALRLLVDQLRNDDRVGIVVYGTEGRVLLEPVALGGQPGRAGSGRSHSDDPNEEAPGTWGAGRLSILEAIDRLCPEGSTNAEHGLRLGYEMARRGYRAEAINRIVLCSDGVANVGVTGPASILARVRSEADRGIHLTTIGFGMGNYNDVLMEQLADRGDGNHYYVDDIDEARRVLVENLTGTLQTIAKDAKVQVEFDSTRVLRYRLLGFENRDVADRDFRNDKVDAGEIGAGHEVTALYEVKLAPQVTQGTLATVRLRYARPEHEGTGAPRVREIERRFDAAALDRRFEDAAPRLRLDAAVAEFAEILRGSYWAREGRLSDVLSVARDAARSLNDDTTAGFVSLVEKAAVLSGRSKPGEREQER